MKTKTNVKTLIVGLDFSEYSKIVVKQAQAVAKKWNVDLVYAHVFNDPILYDWQHTVFDKEIASYYRDTVRNVYKLDKKSKIEVRLGTSYKQLIKIADNYSKPMIIVGHGGDLGTVVRFFLGSTAERLALHSKYPVWIHRGEKPVDPKKILIPCDFSKRSIHAINGSKNLGLNNAKFELFHVLQPPVPVLDYPAWLLLNEYVLKNNAKQSARFKKRNAGLKLIETESNDVVGEISKKSKKYDLIAITPRSHKGLLPSFGSITSKVVRSGDNPILVLP